MADRMKDQDNKDAQESGRPVQLDREEQQGGKPGQQQVASPTSSTTRSRTSRAWARSPVSRATSTRTAKSPSECREVPRLSPGHPSRMPTARYPWRMRVRRLDHFGVDVADLARAERFYTDVLGMSVTMRLPDQVLLQLRRWQLRALPQGRSCSRRARADRRSARQEPPRLRGVLGRLPDRAGDVRGARHPPSRAHRLGRPRVPVLPRPRRQPPGGGGVPRARPGSVTPTPGRRGGGRTGRTAGRRARRSGRGTRRRC